MVKYWEYKIITSIVKEDFEKLVNKYLKEGWTTVGGVGHNGVSWMQAIKILRDE